MSSLNKVAFAGVSIALAVGLGYALAPIPNIELVTFVVFLSSFYLGSVTGPVAGLIAFALYSLLNPYGIAPPPVFAGQLIGGALIGLGGALFKDINRKVERNYIKCILAGSFGFLVTLMYDIATNIGAYIAAGSSQTFIVFVIGGLSFSAMHLISNTIIFATIFPFAPAYFTNSHCLKE